MNYEEIVTVSTSALTGDVPVSDGAGGYLWEPVMVDVEAITNAEIDALFT